MSDTATFTGLTTVLLSLGIVPPRGRWKRTTLRTLSAVEELLDLLEYTGSVERQFTTDGEAFVVRWR